MTIEELEIVIKANVEQAVQQIKRLKPEIEKATGQVSQTMEKTKISGFTGEIGDGIKKAKGEIKQVKEALSKAGTNTGLAQTAKETTEAVGQTQKAIEATEATTTALETGMTGVASGASALIASLSAVLPIVGGIALAIYAIYQIIQRIKKAIETAKRIAVSLFNLVKNITKVVGIALAKVATFNLGKLLGADVKGALSNLLQYAGTLFSLRSIYQTLHSSANAWLSSQNAQAKQLTANIEYMKYALGGMLAPIMEYLVNLAYTLLRAIQTLLYTLTGVNIFAKATASSMNKTAGGASKASKEMQKLAGIHDEINNIGDNGSGGGGGGGGGITPSFDLSNLDNTPNDIIDAIKTGNWKLVGEVLGNKLNEALESIQWNKIHATALKIGTGITDFINSFVKTANWKNVGNTIAQGLNTAIYFATSFLTNLNWQSLGNAFGNIINGFFLNIDWNALAIGITSKVVGIFNFIAETLATIDFKDIAEAIQGFFTNIDIEAMIDAGFTAVENFLMGITESAPILIATGADIITRIMNGISANLPTLIPIAVRCVLTIAQAIIKNLPTIIRAGIDIIVALIQGLVDALPDLLEEAPTIIATIISGIISVLDKIIEAGVLIIITLVLGLIQALPQIIAFIPKLIQAFVDELPKHLNEIIESGVKILIALIDGLNQSLPILIAMIPTIVQTITKVLMEHKTELIEGGAKLLLLLIQGLNTIKSSLASAMWNILVEGIKNKIISMASSAYTWGRDMIQGFINGIKSMLSNVGNSAQSIANKIKSFLHFSRPDVGPLRDYETYMPDFVRGLAKTMLDSAPILENATKQLADNMSQSINGMTLNNNLGIEGLPQSEDLKVQSSFKETLVGALAGGESNVTIPIKFEIGGQTLIDMVIDGINDKTQRLGRDVILRVGD